MQIGKTVCFFMGAAAFAGLAPGTARAQADIGPRLAAAMAEQEHGTAYPVWVYFRDKGADTPGKAAVELVSDRSLRRRQNVLPPGTLVDDSDLPVADSYVAQVGDAGLRIRHRSRWFNAVSAVATPSQIETVGRFPFVSRIELLGRYAKAPRPEERPASAEMYSPAKPSVTHALDYGGSFAQLDQIQVPPVHDSGNYAQGVLVGVFDDGFRLLNHVALDSLQIEAMYDFVDGKLSVVPDPPGSFLGDHGINTLSTIGAYKPGTLIGPAFGARYILARTEDTRSETPIEEDNWVAAIEWADSIGVQVTSTSLGYLTYDTGFPSWTWEDMDGRTTVISKAAVMAARKGIVVVNSAGNNGFNSARNTLNAPADADSILSVGAVNSDGTRTSFSSVGPTTDVPPRIKPDVMARGTLVLAANAYDTTAYSLVQGTSFSCPLAAGVAALLVAARPNATPQEILTAMRNTASRSSTPDNQYGWGILNAAAALAYLKGTGTGNPPLLPAEIRLDQNFPNPFNPGTMIRFFLPEAATVRLAVYDLLGREVRTLLNESRPAGAGFITWDGLDANRSPAASGAYIARLEAPTAAGSSTRSIRMMLVR